MTEGIEPVSALGLSKVMGGKTWMDWIGKKMDPWWEFDHSLFLRSFDPGLLWRSARIWSWIVNAGGINWYDFGHLPCDLVFCMAVSYDCGLCLDFAAQWSPHWSWVHNPGLGLLSEWNFACSTHVYVDSLQVPPKNRLAGWLAIQNHSRC